MNPSSSASIGQRSQYRGDKKTRKKKSSLKKNKKDDGRKGRRRSSRAPSSSSKKNSRYPLQSNYTDAELQLFWSKFAASRAKACLKGDFNFTVERSAFSTNYRMETSSSECANARLEQVYRVSINRSFVGLFLERSSTLHITSSRFDGEGDVPLQILSMLEREVGAEVSVKRATTWSGRVGLFRKLLAPAPKSAAPREWADLFSKTVEETLFARRKIDALLRRDEREKRGKRRKNSSRKGCPLYDSVMSVACTVPFTSSKYHGFGPLRGGFLAYMVRQDPGLSACYAGAVHVVYNSVRDSAKVYDVTLSRKCTQRRRVFLVHIVFEDRLDPEASSARALREWLDDILRRGLSRSGHMAGMTVDTGARSVKYYEPNGAQTSWTNAVQGAIEEYSRRRTPLSFARKYQWISPDDFCPVFGLQRRARGKLAKNMCANYVLALLLLELSCDLTMDEILELVGVPDAFMKQWNCFMYEVSERAGIIECKRAIDRLNKSSSRGGSASANKARAAQELFNSGLIQDCRRILNKRGEGSVFW